MNRDEIIFLSRPQFTSLSFQFYVLLVFVAFSLVLNDLLLFCRPKLFAFLSFASPRFEFI